MNSIKDAHLAYNYVRELVIKDVKNSKLWNLFNIMITDSDDTRHNKFLMRLANKHTDNVAIGILNGNNCLLAGTYKYSLGEYMNVYKIERNNPIVPLMLGITFVHLACQKFSSRKHSLGAKYLFVFSPLFPSKREKKIISFPQLVMFSNVSYVMEFLA